MSDWKLVPVEPTPGMIRAALDCQDADPRDGSESEVYYGYKAMVEAVDSQARECRHCGWMCIPNSTPSKPFYPLSPHNGEREPVQPNAYEARRMIESNDLLRELAALKRHPHKSVRTGLPSGNFYTVSVPIALLVRVDVLLGRIDAALEEADL